VIGDLVVFSWTGKIFKPASNDFKKDPSVAALFEQQ
jgi:hypothetical protein